MWNAYCPKCGHSDIAWNHPWWLKCRKCGEQTPFYLPVDPDKIVGKFPEWFRLEEE